MKFRTKIVVGVAAIQLGFLMVLVLWTVSQLKSSNENQVTLRADMTSSLLAASSRDAMLAYDLATLDSIGKDVMQTNQLVYVRFLSADGTVLAFLKNADLEGWEFNADESVNQVTDNILDWQIKVEAESTHIGDIQFGMDLAALQQVINHSVRATTVIATLAVGVVILFSLFLSRYLNKKLAMLRLASKRVSEGDLEFKIDATGEDEFDETAKAFNAMSAALSAQVSERMQALQDAQSANKAKSAFLAGMSHELRTPLNSIIGFNRILLRKLPEDAPERYRETLTIMLSNSEHLLATINNILDLSRIAEGKMQCNLERVELEKVVTTCVQIVEPLFNEKHLNFEIQVPSVQRTVYTDAEKLKQILINLLSNAAKYTDNGGAVLKVEYIGDSAVTISVVDTGQGITADEQPYLFTRFSRFNQKKNASVQGTGLGLSLVSEYVNLLHGNVTYTDNDGEGSTFIVTLPITEPN